MIMSCVKSKLAVSENSNSVSELSAHGSSSSLLSDMSSFLNNGNDSSNFLVNVDALRKEQNMSETVNTLMDVENLTRGEGYAQKNNVIGLSRKLEEYHDVSEKENMFEDNMFLRDILPTKVFSATSMKRSIRPPLPCILERSGEEKALSVSSFSRSSSSSNVSDDVARYNDYAHAPFIQAPSVTSNLENSRFDLIRNAAALVASKDPNEALKGRINVTSVPMKSPFISESNDARNSSLRGYMQENVDLWGELDKIMDKSIAVEALSSFIDAVVADPCLQFDDADFKGFTDEEANQMINQDEEERLQIITSYYDSSDCFPAFSPTEGMDKNVSMGAYFQKRSSNPFKRKANDSSMFLDKTEESCRNTPTFENAKTNGPGLASSPSKEKMVPTPTTTKSFIESYRSIRESEEFEVKLPDTSLDTLGRYFMGPESNHLAGDPQGMMNYIIEYCKKKADKSCELLQQGKHLSSTGSLDFISDDVFVEEPPIEKNISDMSKDACSLGSSKTLTPNNSSVKRSLHEDFKSCNSQNTQRNFKKLDSDESVMLAYHGTTSKISDSIHFDESLDSTEQIYRKFKEDLLQSCQNSSENKSEQQIFSKQDRFWEREGMHTPTPVIPVVSDSKYLKSTRPLSLEMLRSGNRSPPERLNSFPGSCKESSATLSVGSAGGAHSTPLHESLAQEMAKQLGLEHLWTKSKSPSLGNTVCSDGEFSRSLLPTQSFNTKKDGSDEASKIGISKLNSEKHIPERGHDANEARPSKLSVTDDQEKSRRVPKRNPQVKQSLIHRRMTHTEHTSGQIDSCAQTSVIVPTNDNASVIPVPTVMPGIATSFHQQSVGFPLIIQIHCGCSSGVHVSGANSNIITTSTTATNYSQQYTQQYQPQQTYQEQPSGKADNTNSSEGVVVNSCASTSIVKSEVSIRKETKVIIEVDKYDLGWGCVEIGKTETNTICLSNRQRLELRFKVVIDETSKIKNFQFALDPQDSRIKRFEREGSIPALGSRKLVVNFTPQKSGPLSAKLNLRFHSVPYTFGFRSEISLFAHGGEGQLTISRAISQTALFMLGKHQTRILTFTVSNVKELPVYVGVVVTDPDYMKLPKNLVQVEPEEFILPGQRDKEIILNFTKLFSLKYFKVHIVWIENISRLRYIRSRSSNIDAKNRLMKKTSPFINESIKKLLDGLSFQCFKKESTAGEIEKFQPTFDDFTLLHKFRTLVIDLSIPEEPDINELKRFSDIGFVPSNLDFLDNMFKNRSTSMAPPIDFRVGDCIKIHNTNINFSKLPLGNTSRKVVSIRNKGLCQAKFMIKPQKDIVQNTNIALENVFTPSAYQGIINENSVQEIVFSYKPTFLGFHRQKWDLEVRFMYNTRAMAKSTVVTLEGEGVNLGL